MPSTTSATLKRWSTRAPSYGRRAGPARVWPAHGADRGFRDRRGVDPWQHDQHDLLAVHCRQFLAPPFAALAAGALIGDGDRSAHAANSERADRDDGRHRRRALAATGVSGARRCAAVGVGFALGFAADAARAAARRHGCRRREADGARSARIVGPALIVEGVSVHGRRRRRARGRGRAAAAAARGATTRGTAHGWSRRRRTRRTRFASAAPGQPFRLRTGDRRRQPAGGGHRLVSDAARDSDRRRRTER